jgi:hypothetical protein
MQKQQFNVTINAPKEKVWEVLWNKTNYQVWTSAFTEGSTVETDDWKQGSKILFLDGKRSGMVSTVYENIPNEVMSFKHLGVVKNGVEDTTSENVQAWAGAIESYKLNSISGKTELNVELDMNEEFKDYFLQTFPKALAIVKELAERN